MKTSRSFDQAADSYDNTRPLVDVTSDVGIRSLLEAAGEGARILEVGTGTGRISIPMLERGADLIGCDLSVKMLRRQQEKYPAARLVQSDAALLPFPSAHFDCVLTVHVMHLIGPWREALREFKRVLKTGGTFLNVSTYATVGESVRVQMRDHWRRWVTSQGVDVRHPGAQSGQQLKDELRSMGAQLREVEVVRFPHTYTLREEFNHYETRVSSDTWSVPEAIYQASLAELRIWAEHESGDFDQEHEETSRFMFDVALFDTM